MQKHKIGLLNLAVRVGENLQPSNVMTTEQISPDLDRVFLIPKPSKQEKQEYNIHSTVKPLLLCEHLIKLSAFAEDALVLDPFVGSGTSAVATKNLGKNYIGMDINKDYVKLARRRLQEVPTLNNSDARQHSVTRGQESLQLQLKAKSE